MPTDQPQTLLRIALTMMLLDPRAGLSATQVQWLQSRLQRYDRLTPLELTKLKGPLLAWSQRELPPANVALLVRHFEEETP